MHIMIQITDHVELYYTVRQIIIKKDSVGKIFFFLFPNAQLFTHTLEHTIFFFFLDQLQPVQESKRLALKSGSNRAMCFTVVCLFKH